MPDLSPLGGTRSVASVLHAAPDGRGPQVAQMTFGRRKGRVIRDGIAFASLRVFGGQLRNGRVQELPQALDATGEVEERLHLALGQLAVEDGQVVHQTAAGNEE